MAKYNQELTQTISSQEWEAWVEELYVVAQSDKWTDMHLKQYNELDSALTQAKLNAEQWCRKFHAGNTLWMLALTQAIQQIQYWKGIAKHTFRGKISMTVLKRRAAKRQLTFACAHWALPNLSTSQRVKLGYDDYYTIKAQKDCRDTWLSQVIEAITSAKDIPKTCLWKQI